MPSEIPRALLHGPAGGGGTGRLDVLRGSA